MKIITFVHSISANKIIINKLIEWNFHCCPSWTSSFFLFVFMVSLIFLLKVLEKKEKRTKQIKWKILALNGSHDAVCEVMYVDVLRPTSERQPIELLRRPEVRSVGIGNIFLSLFRSFFFLVSVPYFFTVDDELEITVTTNVKMIIFSSGFFSLSLLIVSITWKNDGRHEFSFSCDLFFTLR